MYSSPDLDVAAWHRIDWPGDINAVLVRDGVMPDPHIGDQARQCLWVTSRAWWARLCFAAPARRHAQTGLCLDGVDGPADVFLNGARLGCVRNAFRPHRFEVGERMTHDRPNVLLLHFHALDRALGRPRGGASNGWGHARVRLRKPQFNFGWDWALPLPSLGILGGVWLEDRAGPRFTDVSVRPHSNGRVDIRWRTNLAAREAGARVSARLTGPGADVSTTLPARERLSGFLSLTVPEPRLWWPRGLGAQPLYDVTLRLQAAGKTPDRWRRRIGFREVRLLEEPFTADAGPGQSFWLTVNGRRIFCKGANWVPLELWPAQARQRDYEFYLQKTLAAGFNIQRVWGGGLYEREVFYERCDELGIMVWQDFMFASAGYPVAALQDEIVAEARYQIRRLRSHPCVVLWCGCNEDVYSWSAPEEPRCLDPATADSGEYADAAHAPPVDRRHDDPLLYSMILRGLVDRDGLGTPYIESSPQSYEDCGNMPESGNAHLSCWKYALFETGGRPERFRGHFEKAISFNSEFCIQGPCCARTLRHILPPDHRWPPDKVWTFHIQRGHRHLPHHEQTLAIAQGLIGPVRSLDDYVKYGQAVHAEMMRAEFEAARRDRPNCGGTMVWMWNDCWPTSNWSLIDYYRRPKPAFFAARRACAPHLPIFFERAGWVECFFSNDAPEPCRARIVYGQRRLDGAGVWERATEVAVADMATARFDRMERAVLRLAPGDYLYMEAMLGERRLPPVYYFPDGWRDVPWPDPEARVERSEPRREQEEWITRLRVHTTHYGRFLHLKLPAGAWPSDNFFDLGPGLSREVIVRSRKPLSPEHAVPGHWHTRWE